MASTETKWTPGPWRVEQGTTLVWADCSPDDNSNGLGRPVAEVCVNPSDSWVEGPRNGEAEATATLIAAAPDLYWAVERLARWNGKGDPSDMIAMAQTALAKAEGR